MQERDKSPFWAEFSCLHPPLIIFEFLSLFPEEALPPTRELPHFGGNDEKRSIACYVIIEVEEQSMMMLNY